MHLYGFFMPEWQLVTKNTLSNYFSLCKKATGNDINNYAFGTVIIPNELTSN